MILQEGDHFWMTDDLEPVESGIYNGRRVWMMRRIEPAKLPTPNPAKIDHKNGESSSDDLLSITDVMREVGMGKSWTYRRIQTGEIPSMRMGRNIKVRRKDLLDWIEKQRVV